MTSPAIEPDAPKRRWIRVPTIEPLMVAHCWEHTPLDYYRYGEYPRFLRPVDAHEPRWEWKLRAALNKETP